LLDLLKPQVFPLKNNKAFKNNDNNVPNIENLLNLKNLNYVKDTKNNKNSNLITNHDNIASNNYRNSNNHILNIRNSNNNFDKCIFFFNYIDKSYLNEKIAYLNSKIEEDLVKRDKLISMLNQQNTEDQIENVKKLENEIKNFKKIKHNCLSTFSQLTEEINELKKEIAKHSYKINFDLNNFTSEKENRVRKINVLSPNKLYQ